jgi:cold shock CspA family protein
MVGVAVNLNVDRGFFFLRVEVDQRTVDFFTHRSDLRNVRIHEVAEGDSFRFEPTETPKGPRASEVERVEPVDGEQE